MAEKEITGSSEAEIAVHWREEGLIQPTAGIHRPGQHDRPGHLRAVQPGRLPRVLQGVRRPARLGRVLAHDARHQQPAVLEVVRRRQAQRLLQLRRPAPGASTRTRRPSIFVPEPDDEKYEHITYQELYRPGERVRGAAARLLRAQDRRPGDLPHADGAGAAGHDAGLRPARRHPLARCSAVSAARPAATASPTRRAASWSRWTPTTATAS